MITECPICAFDKAYYDAVSGCFYCPKCNFTHRNAIPFILTGNAKYMML